MRHVLAVLVVLLLAGCATAEVRALKPEERKPLGQALDPLLRAAYGADLAKCKIAVGTLDEDDFDVAMRRPGEGPCELSVVLTAPALTQLTPRALQTLLAHELAHTQNAHAVGAARVSEVAGSPMDRGRQSRLRVGNQQFNPEEEAQADATAARLLTVVGRGSNVTCLGLADLYEDIAKDRSRWGHWLSRHPFPERRVAGVVAACDAEQRRPR